MLGIETAIGLLPTQLSDEEGQKALPAVAAVKIAILDARECLYFPLKVLGDGFELNLNLHRKEMFTVNS